MKRCVGIYHLSTTASDLWRRRVRNRKISLLASALLSLGLLSEPGSARETVRLQLKWWHQFQFAGYYAAQEKGFYREEGLDVVILEGGPDQKAPLPMVLGGGAEYGVSDSEIVQARLNGQPVVVCAAIFQHSPYIFLGRKDRGIRTPADLVDKRVMLANEQGAVQLKAMLRLEGIDLTRVRIEQHSWDLEDLIAGQVDAVSAYAMVEPDQIRQRGVEPAILRTVDYGVDFYGDTLFTTDDEARNRSKRVEAFTRASLKGWRYAMDNPSEIADVILQMDGVRERGTTRAIILQQAEGMRPFILPDVVEIGHMNPRRWEQIAKTYATLNYAPQGISLEDFIFAPKQILTPTQTRWLIWCSSGLGGLVVLAMVWTLQLRRRVRLRTKELLDENHQRQEAEQKAKDNQDRVSLILASMGEGLLKFDAEGRIMLINPAAETMLGAEKNSLLGSHVGVLFQFRFTNHDESPSASPTLLKTLHDGITRRVDHEVFHRADGTLFPVEYVCSAVKSPDGETRGVVINFVDITGRKADERRLRKSEAELQVAQRIARVGSWEYVVLTDELVWSEELFRMLGLDPQSSPPPFEEHQRLFTPQSWQRLSQNFSGAVHEGTPYQLELETIRKDGSRGWMLARGEPQFSETGAIICVRGIAQDITESRLAGEKLREQAALLDSAQEAILVIDLEDTVIYWNKGAERTYGWTSAEAVGRKSCELLFSQPAGFKLAMTEVITRGEWQAEMDQLHQDGHAITVDARWTLVRDEQGLAKSILSINSDITDKKNLEAQFLRAQRMESIGTLAGGIAHDLNNVLTPILMSVELLRFKSRDADSHFIIDSIATSARRGADLVRQVLTFARGVDGQRIPVNLALLIQEMEQFIHETFSKKITCVLHLPAKPWTVMGDPTQLHQVMMNLTVNARDAMPDGGQLTLTVTNEVVETFDTTQYPELRPGTYVVISVTDTGPGIPLAIRHKIFGNYSG